MNSETNIALIGPPGVGKSSVGRVLATLLDWRFVDTDDRVARRLGMPVSQALGERGEGSVRHAEEQVCRDLAALEHCVVATGGGFVLAEENRRLLRRVAEVYLLEACASTLADRLRGGDQPRPLLGPLDDRDALRHRIQALLCTRAGVYAAGSFLRVNTEARAVKEIAESIAARHRAGRGLARTRRLTIAPKGHLPCVVHVERGGLGRVGDLLRWVLDEPRHIAVVADENAWRRHGSHMKDAMRRRDFSCSVHQLPGGESSKTLTVASRLYEELMQQGCSRDDCVLAVGGGTVGDVAGFVAATFLRGVPWVFVPTTLLAMVDASIGGKTGVNLPQGKNLVGALHPPRLVLTDPTVLCHPHERSHTCYPDEHPFCHPDERSEEGSPHGATLSVTPAEAGVLRRARDDKTGTQDDRQTNEAAQWHGVAEMIKHGLLGDAELLDALERPDCRLDDENLLLRNMRVKAAFVEEDPDEQGPRVLLNLGHTFAHALERVSGYGLPHGEAVAIGLLGAARLSHALGCCDAALPVRVSRLLARWGLPSRLPRDCDPQAVWRAMAVDKKRRHGALRFVLLRRVGAAVVVDGVEQRAVLRVLRRLC
ncbi:MAG: bifunctional shikimate kinase/3-dehydroquinate synthase [Myxococcota bacterium]